MSGWFNKVATVKGWAWKLALAALIVLQVATVAQLRSTSRRLGELERKAAGREQIAGRAESPRPQVGEGRSPTSHAGQLPDDSAAPFSTNAAECPWQIGSPVDGGADMRMDLDRMLAQAMRDFERMDRMINFDDGWPMLAPSPTMDMRQMPDAFVVDFSLPGLDPARTSVTLEGRLLTVAGETVPRASQSGLHGAQRFEQAVLLPGPVQADGEAKAGMTNGVLRVVVPRPHGEAAGTSLLGRKEKRSGS
jgi:HSP20 family molecular chaperone IbpA